MDDENIVSAKEFSEAPARTKGYLVYMYGARKDQPNIPKHYMPTEDEAEDFNGGMFQAAVEDIPPIKRGLVFCHNCGRTEQATAANFRTGWPICCGHTMSLDSPEERAALKEAKS